MYINLLHRHRLSGEIVLVKLLGNMNERICSSEKKNSWRRTRPSIKNPKIGDKLIMGQYSGEMVFLGLLFRGGVRRNMFEYL